MFAPIRAVLATRPQASPGVLAAGAAVAFVFTATPFLVPQLSSAYAIPLGHAGWISVAQVAGFAISVFVAGRTLSASHGLVVGAGVVLVLANAASAAPVSYPVLLGLRTIAGTAMGITTWIAWADATRHRRGIGDIAAIGPLVAALGSPVVAYVADLWGHRAVFGLLAIVCVVPLPLRVEVIDTPPVGRRVSPSRSNRVLLAALMMLTLAGSALFVFTAAAGARTGLSPLAVAFSFSLNALTGIVATRIDTTHRRWAGGWLLVTGITAWAAGATTSGLVFVFAMALWGLAYWIAVPGVFYLIAERALRPDERIGDAQSMMALGRVIGPAVGGLVLGGGRFAALAAVAGLGMLVAGLTVAAVEISRVRHPSRA